MVRRDDVSNIIKIFKSSVAGCPAVYKSVPVCVGVCIKNVLVETKLGGLRSTRFRRNGMRLINII